MAIAAKVKDKVFGETIKVGEFVEALNSEIFTEEDAPMSVHTEDYTGEVVAVFKKKDSDKIYILGNNFDAEFKAVFTKEEIGDYLSEEAQEVFGFQEKINKSDMQKILSMINESCKDTDLMICTVADADEDKAFTLTGVYKCSEECPAIHLSAAYDDVTFSQN